MTPLPATSATSDQTGLEIERKFLIAPVDSGVWRRFLGQQIEQVYLTVGNPALGRPEVRVRKKSYGRDGNASYRRTMKWGEGIVRLEREWEIDGDEYARACAGPIVGWLQKTRYRADGWEIDLFNQPRPGLMLAEIELSAPDAPLPPLPEPFRIRREATEPALRNAALAVEALAIRPRP